MSLRLPHQLLLVSGRHCCIACGGSWQDRPRGGCPARQRPSALERRPRPAPLCPQCAQRPARRRGLCDRCQWAEDQRRQAEIAAMAARDRADAQAWTRRQLRRWPLLIATTGMSTNGVHSLIEVAVITVEGETAINSLVRSSMPLPHWAQLRYQLQPYQLRAAPQPHGVADMLADTLSQERLLAWNSRYTALLIDALLDATDTSVQILSWDDLRPVYTRYAGDWMPRAGRYRPAGLPGRGPLALQSARAALNVLREMAGEPVFQFPAAQRSRPTPLLDEIDPDPDPDAWIE